MPQSKCSSNGQKWPKLSKNERLLTVQPLGVVLGGPFGLVDLVSGALVVEFRAED